MNSLILDILNNNLSNNSYQPISRSSISKEWFGPCPSCGGKDRFRVWPLAAGGQIAQRNHLSGKWWCRQCNKSGDIIELLIFAKNINFGQACKELRINLSKKDTFSKSFKAIEKKWLPITPASPSEKWQNAATKLAIEANEYLLTYKSALKYLAQRGLPLEAVKKFSLGYLTGEKQNIFGRFRNRTIFDLPYLESENGIKKNLWIPRGLTIPLWLQNQEGEKKVHRLRIRRPKADLKANYSKFLLLTGSSQKPLILVPKNTTTETWVIVEAELDAMAVYYACKGRVGVIATLTNLGKPDSEAHEYLHKSELILVALDFDALKANGKRPGYEGYLWWQKQYTQAKRWPVPVGKDPGEAFALGVDLAQWIYEATPFQRSL